MAEEDTAGIDFDDIWKKFLEGYKEPNDGPYAYQDQLRGMEAHDSITLVVDYTDVTSVLERAYSIPERNQWIVLSKSIVRRPEQTRESCERSALSLLRTYNQEYFKMIEKQFKVAFKNTLVPIKISTINHTHLSQIANITGIITEIQEPLSYTKKRVFQCENGHKVVRTADGIAIDPKPLKCGVEKCGSGSFSEMEELAEMDTYQKLRISEKMMINYSAKIPRELEIVIVGSDMVDKAEPGDYVVVDGVLQVQMLTNPKMNALGTFVLKAYWIQVQKEELEDIDPDIENQVKRAIDPKNEEVGFEKLWRSVAPVIRGNDMVKKNLLLMMAGSDVRYLGADKRHRGELQTLIVGDSSVGKTTFGEYMMLPFNRSIWASGVKGASTAVGLRASIVYDNDRKAARISAGSYVMASTKYGGIVVIDEIDKMTDEDRKSILEATDDRQKVTIRKHQMSKEIQVNCASLHLCNPKTTGQVYDDKRNIHQNTGLDTPILSRYDTIWVIRDVIDEVEDEANAVHYLKMLSNSKTEEDYIRSKGRFSPIEGLPRTHSIAFMKAWSQYVRITFHPKIDFQTKAGKMILDFYQKMRKSSGQYNLGHEAEERISKITLREIGGLVRLAEASARAHHRDDVKPQDAELAIEIINTSIASSGFDPMTGKFVPYNTMKVSPAAEEKDEKDREWEKSWKKRGSIYYDAIQKSAMKVCPNCRGRLYTIEKGFGDEGHQMPCEACNKTGRVDDLFREEDLKDLLYKKMQPPSSTQELQINGIIVTMKREGILMESGGNLLGVGSWEQLEKWASRYV